MWLAIIISAILYSRIWILARVLLRESKDVSKREGSFIMKSAKAMGWYPFGETSSCNTRVMI